MKITVKDGEPKPKFPKLFTYVVKGSYSGTVILFKSELDKGIMMTGDRVGGQTSDSFSNLYSKGIIKPFHGSITLEN